jgi:hypothetical protein
MKIITSKTLEHKGGFYFYRVHDKKRGNLCENVEGLNFFLDEMFRNCPDSYFNGGPRSSSLKFRLPLDVIEIQGHEVSSLARTGLELNKNRYNSNHMKVQTFMLENDNNTIGMEIPIWLKMEDLNEELYMQIFKSFAPLTGHIDILRIEDGKIWIWDYKPNANKERYAMTQTYFYALMLSKRTGVPLNKFRCGWFDANFAFLFKPKSDLLEKNKNLSKFI